MYICIYIVTNVYSLYTGCLRQENTRQVICSSYRNFKFEEYETSFANRAEQRCIARRNRLRLFSGLSNSSPGTCVIMRTCENLHMRCTHMQFNDIHVHAHTQFLPLPPSLATCLTFTGIGPGKDTISRESSASTTSSGNGREGRRPGKRGFASHWSTSSGEPL